MSDAGGNTYAGCKFGICHHRDSLRGARGADQLGEVYAQQHGIPLKIFKAEWDKYGKSAGYRRNELIVKGCDMLAAFWDGESKGTKHSIDLAVKHNKPVFIYKDWKENE